MSWIYEILTSLRKLSSLITLVANAKRKSNHISSIEKDFGELVYSYKKICDR